MTQIDDVTSPTDASDASSASSAGNAHAAPDRERSRRERWLSPQGAARERLEKWVKRLAAISAFGMFLVLMQGTMVTTTGSGDGCGNSWPLCHGEFIPQYTVATAIEYSHRLVTSLESFFIMATAIGGLILWRNRIEMRILIPMTVFFLLLQAGLGAAAVMWPTSDEVMALHFGISLTAFASTLILATLAYGMKTFDTRRDLAIPKKLAWLAWGLLGYTWVVVYLGAYTRHTEANLACLDWPLCNGSVFPGFSGPVGTVFTHRIAAFVLVLGMIALVAWTWKIRDWRPDLFWSSNIALALVLIQSMAGAAVVWSRMDVFATLSHGIFVSLYWGVLAFMAFQSLPRPAIAKREIPTEHRVSANPSLGQPVPAGVGD